MNAQRDYVPKQYAQYLESVQSEKERNKKNKGFGGFVSVHSTRASSRWHSSLTRSSSESRRRKEGRLLLSNPHTNQADRPRVEEDGVSSQGDRHGVERADVHEQGGEERLLVCAEEHVQVAGDELSLLPQRVQPREDRHLQRRIHSQQGADGHRGSRILRNTSLRIHCIL